MGGGATGGDPLRDRNADSDSSAKVDTEILVEKEHTIHELRETV